MSLQERRHFVFVESNTTGTGRIAVERLLRAGDAVTFLARRPEMYPFLADAAGDLRVEEVETNDRDAVGARIDAIRRGRGVDVLLTFSEYYIAMVAELAAEFGFPYLDPQVARRCRDKHETRKTLSAAGLPTPGFRVVSSLAEAERLSRETPYPCVLKPLSESSSAGVLQVADAAAFVAHFETLNGQRQNARGQTMKGDVLVESLLTGPEYSVESVTLGRGETHVVGITEKHLSAPPYFAETGHDFPALLDPEDEALIRDGAVAALEAVGYDFGPAHTEVRLTPEGEAVVVEINPRLAGGMIPELVSFATGIDMLDVLLTQLAGRDVDLEAKRRHCASIRFLDAPSRGRLAAVEGLDEARLLPLVREASLNKKIGAEVWPATEATARLGQVIAAGEDRRSVIGAVEDALARLRVVVEQTTTAEV